VQAIRRSQCPDGGKISFGKSALGNVAFAGGTKLETERVPVFPHPANHRPWDRYSRLRLIAEHYPGRADFIGDFELVGESREKVTTMITNVRTTQTSKPITNVKAEGKIRSVSAATDPDSNSTATKVVTATNARTNAILLKLEYIAQRHWSNSVILVEPRTSCSFIS
jgi:hypothetical protein